MRPAEIIVGIDASPESRIALRWAADEATRRGRKLRVVHGVHSRWPDSAFSPEHAQFAAQRHAPEILAGARADLAQWAPDIETDLTTEFGGAAAALVAAAQPGDLVVVGNRGHSTFAALLAGSTCQQVALHAPASVVVVRGRTNGAGGIVVGFDGSPMAGEVLTTAFDMAEARGCPLTVLRAFRPSTPAWPAESPPPDLLNAMTAKLELQVELAESVVPMSEKYPTVTAEVHVVGGDPADLLVEASRTAGLVVVGSRGHGGFTGLLLGSVGLHLMHHSRCPVLIARPAS
ncbi:universal stress protein [Virgisporangium ochraceum]|uniref:Universal stress protein n=1 Tax=Virgisporangium ochraceum TaxID=65505 RepID=A0A8J3ZWS9_9ACTN|nr:universal stress protein [Virgisporangium ochraceum]GIJ71504.1 universal stress protein [Virgisporangium ochraceum]